MVKAVYHEEQEVNDLLNDGHDAQVCRFPNEEL